MTIQAIETTYQGARFRSRLEARWAVFFDALRIKWQYEPEGFAFESRLQTGEHFTYLPDFWLPELRMWAEVKGSLDVVACRRLIECAAALCERCDGPNFLVLGPIESRDRSNYPTVLHMHKGSLYASPWENDRDALWCGPLGHEIANDADGPFWAVGCALSTTLVARSLLRGWKPIDRRDMSAAVDMARSARFEHGQAGSVW